MRFPKGRREDSAREAKLDWGWTEARRGGHIFRTHQNRHNEEEKEGESLCRSNLPWLRENDLFFKRKKKWGREREGRGAGVLFGCVGKRREEREGLYSLEILPNFPDFQTTLEAPASDSRRTIRLNGMLFYAVMQCTRCFDRIHRSLSTPKSIAQYGNVIQCDTPRG